MAMNPHTRGNPAVRAEKKYRAYQLKLDGYSLQEICDQMKAERYTGVSSKASIKTLIDEQIKDNLSPLVDEYRAVEYARLENQRRRLLAIIEREHVVVNSGRVVRHGEPKVDYDDEGNPIATIDEDAGAPVLDDGPRLKAEAELLKVAERMAKLFGLDAPTKVEGRLETTGVVIQVPGAEDV